MIDLHIHTIYSGGKDDLKEVLKTAESTDRKIFSRKNNTRV